MQGQTIDKVLFGANLASLCFTGTAGIAQQDAACLAVAFGNAIMAFVFYPALKQD